MKKDLTPEEIAYKYVHGHHDALTDNQEKKDMAEDILNFAKEFAKMKVKEDKMKCPKCGSKNTFKSALYTNCNRCNADWITQAHFLN